MKEEQRQFVLALLGYAVRRDCQVQKLCNDSGIVLDELMKGTSGALQWSQINSLWGNASNACRDELFGLHFGESLQLGALGVVGEIIKVSNTIGDAVTIACSMAPAITDLFTLSVSKSKKSFTINFRATPAGRDNKFVSKQVAEFLMAFTVHELDGILLTKLTPDLVQIPGKVGDSKEYARVFRRKPAAGNDYSMTFDIRYWDDPIFTANYDLQRLYIEKLNSAMPDPDATISFQVNVMEYLMKNAYLGMLSLDDVAANFNMTPRSLQRRLHEESVTFHQLSDSVRKSLALHYIGSGKHQMKEISEMLGYNEVSAFSRAVKRWTGKTPGELYVNREE